MNSQRSRDSYSMGTHKGIYGDEIGVQIDILLKRLPIKHTKSEDVHTRFDFIQRLFFVISLQLSLFSFDKGSCFFSDTLPWRSVSGIIYKKKKMTCVFSCDFTIQEYVKLKIKYKRQMNMYQVVLFIWHKKQVSIFRKCHNQRPQTNPWHRVEETMYTYSYTTARHNWSKASISLRPQRENYETKNDTKNCILKQVPNTKHLCISFGVL